MTVTCVPYTFTRRPLPAIYSTGKAVNYSPYRTENRDTEVVTRDNVLQDLGLLAQGGFTLIRTFDSTDEVAGLLLQIIKDNRINIKVQLGIYLAPTAFGTDLAAGKEVRNFDGRDYVLEKSIPGDAALIREAMLRKLSS